LRRRRGAVNSKTFASIIVAKKVKQSGEAEKSNCLNRQIAAFTVPAIFRAEPAL